MSVNPIGLIQSGLGDALGTGLGGCPSPLGECWHRIGVAARAHRT